MSNVKVERGYLTQSLGNASHSGEHGFKTVPGLLTLVLEKEAWKNRIIVQTGEEFPGFSTFEAYLGANPPKGLGIDVETLDRLIGKDEDLRTKFYAALRRPTGKHINGVNNVNTIDRSQGNTKAYALQKLSDEGQVELLNQVKAGKLSANQAMKQAGYRKPKIAVSLDNPQSAARTLLTHASPEFLVELRRLLVEEMEGTQS